MSFIHEPDLPSRWNKDLAYIFGLLLGDGSLPNSNTIRPNGKLQKRHVIHFVSDSKDFTINVYQPLFEKVFGLEPKMTARVRKNRNVLYECRIESKKLYVFLVKMGYTSGRKARIATIPKMPSKYEIYLLAGLLDTDGGKKGNGFGLSTASPHFARFCEEMFKKLNLSYNSCPWHYKDHIYHQVYVPKSEMHKLLKAIPIQNKDKIEFIKTASVAQSVRALPW